MKHLPHISLILLLFTSCSKNTVLPGQSYHGPGGSFINFSNIKWYLTKNSGSATVNLSISGNTNADKLTMTTSGDGLLSEIPVTLKSGKFTEDISVAFAHTTIDTGTMQASTQITVYKGSNKLVVPLESGKINLSSPMPD